MPWDSPGRSSARASAKATKFPFDLPSLSPCNRSDHFKNIVRFVLDQRVFVDGCSCWNLVYCGWIPLGSDRHTVPLCVLVDFLRCRRKFQWERGVFACVNKWLNIEGNLNCIRFEYVSFDFLKLVRCNHHRNLPGSRISTRTHAPHVSNVNVYARACSAKKSAILPYVAL